MALSISDLPPEIVLLVLSNLSLRELATLQATNTHFYNLILCDSQFSIYNTVKFFELYYKRRLFAIFLFPFVHPRLTYLGASSASTSSTSSPDADMGDQEDDTDISPGNTPFHIAASNGLHSVIRMFLSTNSRGYSNNPLKAPHMYAQESSQYVSLTMHNSKCRLVDLLNNEPNTPLHYISVIPEGVSEQLVLETAHLLLDHDACIDTRGRAGNNVLVEAAQHGQVNMVKLLIECLQRGGRGDAELKRLMTMQNDYEENAVILASRGHPDVLDLLLANGADPNSERKGYSALHILCSRFNLDSHDPSSISEYHFHISSPVEGFGAHTPRYTDGQHSSSSNDDLWNSDESWRQRAIKSLIAYGADIRGVEASTGMKPLHVAAFWGDKLAIECLIEAGVDPNSELNPMNGWLPVHYACSEGQIFSVQLLIEHGARVWDSGEIPPSAGVTDAAGEMVLPVPQYPFEIDISALPAGLVVPAPLELMSFDALKSKIRRFATQVEICRSTDKRE